MMKTQRLFLVLGFLLDLIQKQLYLSDSQSTQTCRRLVDDPTDVAGNSSQCRKPQVQGWLQGRIKLTLPAISKIGMASFAHFFQYRRSCPQVFHSEDHETSQEHTEAHSGRQQKQHTVFFKKNEYIFFNSPPKTYHPMVHSRNGRLVCLTVL